MNTTCGHATETGWVCVRKPHGDNRHYMKKELLIIEQPAMPAPQIKVVDLLALAMFICFMTGFAIVLTEWWMG